MIQVEGSNWSNSWKNHISWRRIATPDGHSQLLASNIPNCISYDPTFAYEMATIFREGLRRMHEKKENVFYYITAMNENYAHPEKPKGIDDGILKGMYLFKEGKNKGKLKFNY